MKQVQAAKQFFGEQETMPASLVPKKEGSKLSALEQQASMVMKESLGPMKHVKHGPIKLSKKIKIPKDKDDDE